MPAVRSRPAVERLDDEVLVLVRTFDAPRELVYAAFTEARHFVHWFAPHGFTISGCEIDARPGGKMRFIHHSPDGRHCHVGGVTREAVAPERWVTTLFFADASGKRVSPTVYGVGPEVPEEMLMTVTLEALGNRTRVTVRQTTPAKSAHGGGATAGWTQSFERLVAYLESQRHDAGESTALAGESEILATRLLDAPRDLVFEVWTDPEHLGEWWGPTGFRTTTHRHDARGGGEWRFVMHGPDGTDYQNHVTFLEVERPRRLVYKHGGAGETEAVNFKVEVLFEEVGARTRLTMRMLFPSRTERDFVCEKYGAFEGLKETMGRLRDYVARLRTTM